MSTIAVLWQGIESQYNNGTFPTEQLEKIDELVFSDDIENIRNGLTLMTTIASECLCRYLELDRASVVLRETGRFRDSLSVEQVLVESVKGESMWQDLYGSGAFESMEFRVLGDMAIENLSDSEKAFCVRMAREMVRVPAGEFMMGALENDGDAYDDEKSRHRVTLTRDLLMGKYPVTQAFWESVMESNPSMHKGANRPVEKVSWLDVVAFCNKLSEREGLEPAYTITGENVTCNWSAKGYRLPTEAEWEYSARSGQRFTYSGSNNVAEVAWYEGNSGDETHPVGQKKPNGFGLCDMSGNVYEWVWDVEGDYSGGSQTDPTGPDSGSIRVRRGGGWSDYAWFTRVSARFIGDPTRRFSDLGFRLVRFVQ